MSTEISQRKSASTIMKFAILGATGGSGLCVVKQALDEGNEVTAIVRDSAKLRDIQHENFKVVEGDVFLAECLQPHFEGCDAVISCLGTRSLMYSTTIYSATMKAIVTAMRGAQVKRVIVMSSWYVTVDPDDDPGYKVRWFVRSVLTNPFADLAVMEDFLEKECQDIDYTVVRPPRLIDGPSAGQEFVVEIGRMFCTTENRMIPRVDVARFILKDIPTEEHYKKLLAIGLQS